MSCEIKEKKKEKKGGGENMSCGYNTAKPILKTHIISPFYEQMCVVYHWPCPLSQNRTLANHGDKGGLYLQTCGPEVARAPLASLGSLLGFVCLL